ncbi:hypothetical protein [Pseudooctadecabacter jejudonensis]|uniref:Uncharacterized protein n=1 Tax=Pseudooctadecabacter jejudonensis TaxID=1391910 RepID=A0A1Y5RKV2_9RHOB|nr:hypothetical protein [Pseudooctadecabacter jejudonensis]SLN19854.1 hypothetical protein PSJ8397_00720 [Pseudooctadecabacter jejudonensis]
MNALLIAVLAAAFGYVGVAAVLGDAASANLVVGYVVASGLAAAVSYVRPGWAARVKWAWIILSLVVIYGIISGPLNYLRLNA